MLRVGHVSLVCVCIACPPGEFCRISGPRPGRVTKSLAQAQSKDWVRQGGLPFAGQTVKPFAMAVITVRLGWVVPWQVPEPLVAKRFVEVSSPSPEVTYCRKMLQFVVTFLFLCRPLPAVPFWRRRIYRHGCTIPGKFLGTRLLLMWFNMQV